MRPLNDRVIVKPDDPDEKIGSIIIAESARQNSLRGTVVAVGRGRLREDGALVEMQVKVGDRVYYGWGANEIEFGGQKCLCLHESDIMAVIE